MPPPIVRTHSRPGPLVQTRRTFVATSMVALLAVAGVTAAIAADPAEPPPPRIAFLANGIVPADALAAGPIAGQLGAPIYTTQPDVLPAGTAGALGAYGPELVVVLGGPVAIHDTVVTQVAAATGLDAVAPSPTPTAGIVRAAGGDRFETATIVAKLLEAYAPAYLLTDLQAADADLLDGQDSSAFARTSDLPVLEMVPAPGTSTNQPPDPLPEDQMDFSSQLDVAFTTTATGRLHISHQAVFGLSCEGTEWVWLALDGIPIRDSVVTFPPNAHEPMLHTLLAVTTDPVPAGSHTITLQGGADTCTALDATTVGYATGTVLVLGD